MPQTGKRAESTTATAFTDDLTDNAYQNPPSSQQQPLNQTDSTERADGKSGLVSTDKFFNDTDELVKLYTRTGDHITAGPVTIHPGHALIVTENTTLDLKANNCNVCPGAKIVIEAGATLTIRGGDCQANDKAVGRMNLFGELINHGTFICESKLILARGCEFINASNAVGANGAFMIKNRTRDANGAALTAGKYVHAEMLELMNSLPNKLYQEVQIKEYWTTLTSQVATAGSTDVNHSLPDNGSSSEGAQDGTQGDNTVTVEGNTA